MKFLKENITRKRKILIETNEISNKEYIYSIYCKKKFYIHSEYDKIIYIINEDIINEDIKNWPKTKKEVYNCFSPRFFHSVPNMYIIIKKDKIDYLSKSGLWIF